MTLPVPVTVTLFAPGKSNNSGIFTALPNHDVSAALPLSATVMLVSDAVKVGETISSPLFKTAVVPAPHTAELSACAYLYGSHTAVTSNVPAPYSFAPGAQAIRPK